MTLNRLLTAKSTEVSVRNVVMCDVDGATVTVADEPVVGTITIQ